MNIFIIVSMDSTAKLFDCMTLEHLKTIFNNLKAKQDFSDMLSEFLIFPVCRFSGKPGD